MIARLVSIFLVMILSFNSPVVCNVVLCQDLVQHKMRNFNYFQLTNSDSLATLAL